MAVCDGIRGVSGERDTVRGKMQASLRGLAAALLLGVPLATAASDRQAPAMKLPLEKLGFPGVSKTFLEIGSSMLTLHFLDDTHLLVTYSLRGLVPRLVGDPQDDDDRVVAAEVVELPAGKVLAQTQWHMHDHARYLWSLRDGRFLLRIGEQFYTMAPLARLQESDPFARTVFPGRRGRPVLVETSSDGEVLTVETQLPEAGESMEAPQAFGARQKTMTVFDFYRLHGAGSAGDPLSVKRVGGVNASEPFLLPLNGTGYVWPEETGNNRWTLRFDDYSGATRQVGLLDSTCPPRVELVSTSEYVAMTCRGASDRVRMGSYGFDGVETWQEDLGDFGPPRFAFAPEAGRFAVSRNAAGVPALPQSMGVNQPGTPDHQEVRVYQNASGDLLLKVEVTPSFKTAENFDLSADGSLLAVVREGEIAVYKLPGLGKRDKEDIAEVKKFAPPENELPVKLGLLARAPTQVPIPEIGEVQGASRPAASTAAASAGDAAPAARKPPTLLNPGEKAEVQGSRE